MTGRKKEETRPFSLRLTKADRAMLERQAGRMALGSYIRARLLGGMEIPSRSPGMTALDRKALTQCLGELGRSRVAENLSRIRRTADAGLLPLTPETDAALRSACEAVVDMKRMLMAKLGIRER